MRYIYILKVLSLMLIMLGACMLLPLLVALYFTPHDIWVFATSSVSCAALGLALYLSTRRCQITALSRREGILIVVLTWTAACFFGALPYYLSHYIPHFTDCLFESVSGFTTTGASILSDIEALPKDLLIWRNMTNWLGGMGMIVLALAVLPFVGSGGMQLYRAEMPGPVEDKLRPRIKDTSKILWQIYVLITCVGIFLLAASGMPIWEATCNVFGAIATGGFNPRNGSIGVYNSPYIEWVLILIMVVGGTNFSLYYWLRMGKPGRLFHDNEWRFYISALGLLAVTISFSLFAAGVYPSLGQSFRYGVFQLVSLGTATGFATADYELWTPLAQIVLLVSMIGLGCAGSTSGGIKSIRTLFLGKVATRELYKFIHPRAVVPLKLKGTKLNATIVDSILGFIFLYLLTVALSTVVLAATGADLLTAFSAVLSCIGGVGPGFGTVGPTENYAHLTEIAKWTLMGCMLLGRLEIYSILILLVPSFWRNA